MSASRSASDRLASSASVLVAFFRGAFSAASFAAFFLAAGRSTKRLCRTCRRRSINSSSVCSLMGLTRSASFIMCPGVFHFGTVVGQQPQAVASGLWEDRHAWSLRSLQVANAALAFDHLSVSAPDRTSFTSLPGSSFFFSCGLSGSLHSFTWTSAITASPSPSPSLR